MKIKRMYTTMAELYCHAKQEDMPLFYSTDRDTTDFLQDYYSHSDDIDKSILYQYAGYELPYITIDNVLDMPIRQRFVEMFTSFCTTNKNEFTRIYNTLLADYEILDNVTESTIITTTENGKEINNNIKNGGNVIECTKSGKEIDENIKVGGTINELVKSGSESDTHTQDGSHISEYIKGGSETDKTEYKGEKKTHETDKSPYTDSEIHYISSEGNDTFKSDEKTVKETQARSKETEETFTNRSDTKTHTFNDYIETKEDKTSADYAETTTHTFNNYKEKETNKVTDDFIDKSEKTFSNYKETTKNSVTDDFVDKIEKSFDGRNTEIATIRHGNIGVTSSQEMITQELRLRLNNSFYPMIFKKFIREHFIA